jgi:hypothetical protein
MSFIAEIEGIGATGRSSCPGVRNTTEVYNHCHATSCGSDVWGDEKWHWILDVGGTVTCYRSGSKRSKVNDVMMRPTVMDLMQTWKTQKVRRKCEYMLIRSWKENLQETQSS